MENSQASSVVGGVSAILLISPDAAARLQAARVAISGPFDHGFAWVVSFRDPDGNHIELLQSSNTQQEG